MTAETIASTVANEVRSYVRDNFTPGSLESLNKLEYLVAAKVWAAIQADRDRTERTDA